MNPKTDSVKRLMIMVSLMAFAGAAPLTAQDKTAAAAPVAHQCMPSAAGEAPARMFEDAADKALAAMKQRAVELDVKGVAVVAYAEGESTTSWSSRMTVVGALKTAPSQNDRGANLLAIAYSKAAEMADTLKASGSGVRPALTGEVGWQGGVVARGKTGILIAAFSGGKSEDDVKISKAGLEVLSGKL